jgi:hypothetical protein
MKRSPGGGAVPAVTIAVRTEHPSWVVVSYRYHQEEPNRWDGGRLCKICMATV